MKNELQEDKSNSEQALDGEEEESDSDETLEEDSDDNEENSDDFDEEEDSGAEYNDLEFLELLASTIILDYPSVVPSIQALFEIHGREELWKTAEEVAVLTAAAEDDDDDDVDDSDSDDPFIL